MRINSCNLGMDSERKIFSSKTRTSHFVASFSESLNNTALNAGTGQELDTGSSSEGSEGTQKSEASDRLANSRLSALSSGTVKDMLTSYDKTREIRKQFLMAMLERILGKDRYRETTENRLGGYEIESIPVAQKTSMTLQTVETYSYSESVSFSVKGDVTCADGRTVSVDFGVNMSRSFTRTFSMTNKITTYTDPLVLNFDGYSAELKNQSFFFDLDCDGNEEKIKQLESGSGYLALDRNNDGIISDGSELFGTKSGDGFADLAAFDEDGNGWIDEDDSVFDRLKIWAFDSEGRTELYSLREKGIGALFLGNVSTEYELINEEAESDAIIRKTGLFLYENGKSSSMQHMDYAM